MRSLDNAAIAQIAGQVSTLCKAWKITRKDGIEINFCEHDNDLTINGAIYSAIKAGNSGVLENDETQGRTNLAGIFSIEAIDENSLLLGRYNGANIKLYLVDWRDTNYCYQIFQGEIGDTKLKENGFEFDIIDISQKLNQKIGRTFSRLCDAQLGDIRCGINLNTTSYNADGVILSANCDELYIQSPQNLEIQNYENGVLKFISGQLAGLEFNIASIFENGENYKINLQNMPRILPQNGDAIKLFFGCDKSFAICKARFNNNDNFRACPHMPGEGVIYARP